MNELPHTLRVAWGSKDLLLERSLLVQLQEHHLRRENQNDTMKVIKGSFVLFNNTCCDYIFETESDFSKSGVDILTNPIIFAFAIVVLFSFPFWLSKKFELH